MGTKYFGGWTDVKSTHDEWADYGPGFGPKTPIEGFPTDDEILLASYGQGSYEGDGIVLFQRDGKLYENVGSHCSCNGLEGQWHPGEVTWEALSLRPLDDRYFMHDHDPEARDLFRELVATHTPPKVLA